MSTVEARNNKGILTPMQQSLLKSLLSSEFYQQNRARVKTSIFDEMYTKMYKTIGQAHDKYGHDLSSADISALWAVNNSKTL